MSISRRDALMGAAVAVAGVPTAVAAHPDPLRAGVQALVNEIRLDLPPGITSVAHWALQQAADRLEALPGIQALPNEYWQIWRQDFGRRFGPTHVLRSAGGVTS